MPSLREFRTPVETLPVVSLHPAVQSHYVRCRRGGTSHNLAEVFAFKRSPALDTETRWLAGHERTLDTVHPLVRERLMAEAKAAGVNADGAVYKSQLARFPGDPEAWVTSKDDVKRVAERRNMKLEGGIEYTPPGYDEAPIQDVTEGEYHVAEDIVREKFRDACEENPDEARRPGAKEELARKLAGHE